VKRRASFCFAAAVWLATEHAYAASIAIVRPSSSTPATTEALNRLQGELSALGLEVGLVERPTEHRGSTSEARDELGRMAADRKLDALIDVVGETSPEAVEIWIVEPSSRKLHLSRVRIEPSSPNAAETLAIRAIEVLRSNFVEIDLAARARSEAPLPPPPRDEPPKRASEPKERLGLEAGLAVLGSVGGVGPALLPLVRFDWAASSWLVAQAALAGLGTRPTIESTLGKATVSQSYGLLGLGYVPPFDSAVRPFLSLSAGALRTALEGQADSPAEGHFVEQWSFLVDMGLGVRFRISEQYYVTPAFHLEVATPYVVVHFVDDEVARLGNPNLVASLTFGAWL
jgi:hypothetical protein